MENRIKIALNLAIIVGIILLAGAALWYVSSFAKSISGRTFSVQGEGKVIVIPDIAQLSLGVITEDGKNLSSLQRGNSEKVNQVISFLKEKGIEAKDIKTQSYNITPRYLYFPCPESNEEKKSCPPPEIVGYTINQTLEVKIRDLNKVGDILAGVVERGVNVASGPNFTIDDPSQLQNQARKEAIAKAKEKARIVAESAGFRVGKFISLYEEIPLPSPIPVYEKRLEPDFGGDFAAPSIEPGSQEIRVIVHLTYEIK